MNMIATAVNEETNNCEHCGRTFVRPSTLMKHVCEQKRRWTERDNVANRIAYGAWRKYYEMHHPNKKKLEYSDFINNSYYGAFLRFGLYCVNIGAINPPAFALYLFKNKVPIDNWPSDRSYTGYLIEYLRNENCLDAVQRSIKNMLDLGEKENVQLADVFKYVHPNKICYQITTGKISPWMLYQSITGKQFLAQLSPDQTNLIYEYIHPERWNIKFKREAESVGDVESIIKNIRGL